MEQDESSKGENVLQTVLENEKVRVLKFEIKPGEKTKMHTHPHHLVCILTDQKLKLTDSDGNENELDVNFGQILYFEPTTHVVENIGKTESIGLVVELKQ